jgi:hypothetical protein
MRDFAVKQATVKRVALTQNHDAHPSQAKIDFDRGAR